MSSERLMHVQFTSCVYGGNNRITILVSRILTLKNAILVIILPDLPILIKVKNSHTFFSFA